VKSWREYKSKYKEAATYAKKKTAQAISAIGDLGHKTGNRVLHSLRSLWNSGWFKGLKPEARFAGWVARLTLVLCVIGIIQAWAFIQSERAFATLVAINFSGGLAPNKELALLVEIGNSGRSTAFIESVNFTRIFVPPTAKLPSTPGYLSEGEISTGPILANGVTRSRVNLHGLKGEPHLILTEIDVRAINDGSFKFYVIGYVSYRDAFTIFGPHTNGFCALYNPRSDPGTPFDGCKERAYTYSH
jgi:hypothetical protein